MSEIMRPISFPGLIHWAQGEYKKHGSVFGIRNEKFFCPGSGNCIELFGSKISVPIGPAAGPHTQLAQNMLAAYLAGARVMELKTVQTMDGEELRKCVPRPCIRAVDEGYNVEWSTELTVPEAQNEYIKAWFLCHIFAKEFNIIGACDFIFNMSVGYSLEGIQSEKIDSYIEGMKNAASTGIWKTCRDFIDTHINLFNNFNKNDLELISPCVSNSITLSTLHGCPQEEIEKIAAYLITEKKLHTYIKCNPTLLGYETARRLLDEMGYTHVSFDDHHFNNDLQFNDAVEMLKRLQVLAKENGVEFGVKLTNTFPVQINRGELPGNEMYMSGPALFPLSINVAGKLAAAFNGNLAISYSGGADCHNIEKILETGIMPITMATTFLKPGGYERMFQLAEFAQNIFEKKNKRNDPIINTLILNALCESVSKLSRYRKQYHQHHNLDHCNSIPLFDCAIAPCMENGCPIKQDIPAYLAEVSAGNFDNAFSIIARDNTAPAITGTLCNHQCQNNCTRMYCDDPLQIRQAKLIAAGNAQQIFIDKLQPAKVVTNKSVAVIGAGPAGIAAAVFLRRNGVAVTVYEKRSKPFGIVQYVIPDFRIANSAIDRDFRMAEKIGVEFKFDQPENYSISELKKNYAFIIIATGTWKENTLSEIQPSNPVLRSPIPDPRSPSSLNFLEQSKKSNRSMELGKRVAVIGGGDVAMDCARAAKRNKGVEYTAVVYRRTRDLMPSQYEEQELALTDGVEFLELLSPESFDGKTLTCEIMRLGDYDHSGRRGIEKTGIKKELFFDTVIGAAGTVADNDLFVKNGIALNKNGFPAVNANCESSVPGVYIAGDCRAGAATVVSAIADGKSAAYDILCTLGMQADFSVPRTAPPAACQTKPNFAELYRKKGIICDAKHDASDALRCLSCNALCEVCVDVCPNRANVMIEVPAENNIFLQDHQVVHIDRMCNECGNCASFCPHGGKPYRDKLTVFSCEEDFLESKNPGFHKTGADTYRIRLGDKSVVGYRAGDKCVPDSCIVIIDTIREKYSYLEV